jgi:hypothetical protein
MDSNEAKRILALYRPGDTDSPDPRMAQALKLAREDPQLAAWFGQHCAAHVKFPAEPEAVTAAPVPKDRPSAGTEHLNLRVMIVMAGAGLALLGAVLYWTHPHSLPPNTFDSYRDRMARLVQRSYPMKMNGTDQAQIRQYFRAHDGAVNFTLPKNLEKLAGAGASVFTWNSQPVSLVGLEAGGANLYLFLIKKSAFASAAIPAQPQFLRVGRLMTASWSVGDTIYLLTGPMDEAGLKSYTE